MGEYIEMEAAIAALDEFRLNETVSKYATVMQCRAARDAIGRAAKVLESLPAADVEPVQEWISVEDRLPDLIPCNAGTAYSEAVIAWTSGRKAMIAVWDGIDWIAPFDYWEAWGEEITHWMPMPQPPKGE